MPMKWSTCSTVLWLPERGKHHHGWYRAHQGFWVCFSLITTSNVMCQQGSSTWNSLISKSALGRSDVCFCTVYSASSWKQWQKIWWMEARRTLLSNIDQLFHEMSSFTPKDVKLSLWEVIDRHILQNIQFRPENIMPISTAAAKICAWV